MAEPFVPTNQQNAQQSSAQGATSGHAPANAKGDLGMPRTIPTPALEVSLESLDSLIEQRKNHPR
ncbi:hypothetical protein [Erwinia piriflorinigrans]|uniref:Uncharacterized protein n=1 Tax=Erwinia piriflorinigrans CFBP 5888 TaxID=1161919 RepID=V5Z8H8_9GAMM|nr:hypothetical protein [Erwinia piriflorinigrans]CCG87519.1 hypothetical protein EPIR_2154 [Erwinia piriflorinigrans CFBP 5888]